MLWGWRLIWVLKRCAGSLLHWLETTELIQSVYCFWIWKWLRLCRKDSLQLLTFSRSDLSILVIKAGATSAVESPRLQQVYLNPQFSVCFCWFFPPPFFPCLRLPGRESVGENRSLYSSEKPYDVLFPLVKWSNFTHEWGQIDRCRRMWWRQIRQRTWVNPFICLPMTLCAQFNRRHHCRRCGRLVCSSCSTKKMAVEACRENPARVCDQCYSYYNREHLPGLVQDTSM